MRLKMTLRCMLSLRLTMNHFLFTSFTKCYFSWDLFQIQQKKKTSKCSAARKHNHKVLWTKHMRKNIILSSETNQPGEQLELKYIVRKTYDEQCEPQQSVVKTSWKSTASERQECICWKCLWLKPLMSDSNVSKPKIVHQKIEERQSTHTQKKTMRYTYEKLAALWYRKIQHSTK